MECPVLHPTREEFSVPFCDYVRKICKENPEFSVIKVIPPAGWSPRKGPLPDLHDIKINTPILQYVIPLPAAAQLVNSRPHLSVCLTRRLCQVSGQSGFFRAALEEQKVRMPGSSVSACSKAVMTWSSFSNQVHALAAGHLCSSLQKAGEQQSPQASSTGYAECALHQLSNNTCKCSPARAVR